MTPADALALLGLDAVTAADPACVRLAYAKAVKADHPDHGGAGANLQRLKDARDTLLCRGDIKTCKLCRGVGKVKGRFGAQVCTACEGSGDHT